MAQFSKTLRVPYAPQQCFDLVSDISSYPDFIRWITAMRVSGTYIKDGISHCLGDAVVGFKGFSERFSTAVAADPEAGTVTASLVKGPFRRLLAQWKIVEVEPNATDVTLDIDYEFKNMLLDVLAAANQGLAVEKILNAFLKEADRRYGASPEPQPTSSEAESN